MSSLFNPSEINLAKNGIIIFYQVDLFFCLRFNAYLLMTAVIIMMITFYV